MTPTSEERKSIVVPKEYQDELDRQAKARARGFEADYLDGAHGLYVLLAHNNALKNEKSEPYATLTEQNAKLLAQIEDLKAELKNEIEQAEAVDYRVEDHNSLKLDDKKLREALREAKFALEWHFNNSKPVEDSGHSDFFNLTANALTQIDSLLEESKPLNS